MAQVTYEELCQELRIDDVKHDPWGTAWAWQFTVASVLHFKRETPCPTHWEYKPSPMGFDIDPLDNLTGYYAIGHATTDALLAFGELLHRFVRACEHAGKSY